MENKILLFARIDLEHPDYSGLKKKVIGQYNAIEALGYEVDLVTSNDDGLLLHEKGLIYNFKKKGTIGKRLNYYRNSMLRLPDVIDFKQYKYMLIRYQMTNTFFVAMLKKIKQQNPDINIIIEIPTFPFYKELITFTDKINLLFELSTRNKLKKYVDQIITYCGQTEIYGIPAIPISNGFDMKGIKGINYKEKVPNVINLLGLANVTKWHAYDRIVRGLKTYYSSKQEIQVYFHIVGEGEEWGNLKKLVADLELGDKVIFYGRKIGADLDKISEISDIGIGSLGMHRIDLSIGSPLKIREYCANGLPFVIAYNDTGFSDDFFGMHKISADESDVDIFKLIEFCNEQKEINSTNELKEYAKKYLSWESQLNKVIPKASN